MTNFDKVENMINWRILKNTVKTYDILFFQGKTMFSYAVRCLLCCQQGCSASKFSHTGLVIRGNDFPVTHKYYSLKMLWNCTVVKKFQSIGRN